MNVLEIVVLLRDRRKYKVDNMKKHNKSNKKLKKIAVRHNSKTEKKLIRNRDIKWIKKSCRAKDSNNKEILLGLIFSH